ncbi:phage portal protein [Rhizobium leguminosarum]|nr:phage portal protein [Rhizobium leguminosarum]
MNFAGVVSSAKKALGFPVEQKAYSLNSPEFADLIGIRHTYSGVSIGGQTALYVPAALQAVRLISETIGSLPCKVYRETVDGKEAAKDHSAYRIVHRRANDALGAGRLRLLLTRDALLHGGGFARIHRHDDGRPFELYRIKPGRVTVEEDDITGFPTYRVADPDGIKIYGHTEILHVPAFDGVSPVTRGKEALGDAAVLERHLSQFFGSGARPSAVITTDALPDNDSGANKLKNVRSDYRRWKDDPNAPLILPPGWQLAQPAITSTDAQFLEHRKEQVNEIARIFGVPPHMLFQLDRATWSNAEQMGATFLQLCLQPWLDRWQEAYATVLLTEEEQDDHYFEFVIDGLQRTDAAGRAEIYGKLIAARVYTPNEVRAMQNMPPLPGGDELMNPHTTSNAAPTTAPAKEPA